MGEMQVPESVEAKSTVATEIWGEARRGPRRTLGHSYGSGFKTLFTRECFSGMHVGSWDRQVSLAVTRASL